MKKLLSIILILALLLPAAAPADSPDPIIGCWYMYIDGEKYPEFLQNIGTYDSTMSIYYFRSDNTIALLENDIVYGAAQPTYASVGRWEKSGDGYRCSIIGLGECTVTLWAESAMVAPDQNQGVSMKIRKIVPFNPYKDYDIKR